MEKLSVLLALCAGNTPVNDEFPTQKPVTQSSDAVFNNSLNKLLKNSWRLFEASWRPCDVNVLF